MKRYAALLTALLMIVSVLPASAEATPADYLGKWYAATGIAYDGTPAYLGSLEISLELSRDKTAVLSYAGIEIHTSWRYLGGGAVLASAGDTQYDMSIEGGRLRIESLPVESGEFGKEKTEVNFSYDDSVPKTYVVFEREPAGDMPELPLKRPAAVEDELYGVYDVMYAVQDGVVFDFIARNLRIKIAYCMADFAGATVMTDFRDGAVIIDDPRLVGSSSGDAIMYIFPTADENMIVIETGGITIYCTKVGESTAKTADAAVAMPSVETMETAARSYLDELGDTYTAEEYLRAVAGGAEPQPEREFEVIKEGPTDTRKIAITVDDLNEVDNLKTILNVANQYNAKITLFAIGDNVDRNSDLRVTLKEAYMMGHEIENHTYDHAKLYSLNDSNMAYQIFATQKAVNNALGYEYQMHFIRMPGGNGEHDLRSHQYLYQLNDLGLADYKAIVNWTFSGSNGKIDEIKNSLKGGHIYLFHCKADDTKKLEEFIPYAVSQGYELVTLNEMLGYPENSISPLKGDALAYEIPEPYPYVYTNLVLLDGKPHSHRGQMYVVQLLQRRLIELGYLSKNAVVDGDFGNDTTIAVKLFQTYNDLDADGQAGPLTQKLLFSSNAKPNTSPYVAGEPDTYPEGGKIDLSVN